MINLLKQSLQAAEEIRVAIREVDRNCSSTIATVKANGVVLDELKLKLNQGN